MANLKRLKLELVGSPLPEDRQEAVKKDFKGYSHGLLRGVPGNLVLTPKYFKYAEDIYNITVRPDDIWVVTFPKAGSHWMQEISWLVANDCNYEGAKVGLDKRVPFFDVALLISNPSQFQQPGMTGMPPIPADFGQKIKEFEERPSPRITMTHIPIHLLPHKILETCKIIYVARNPKDVAVSFYHHHKKIPVHGYVNDFDTFVDYFMRDEVMYSPFFPHVLEAWKLRNHPNVQFAFFEAMKEDLPRELKKLATFLGKSYSDSEIEQLAKYVDFENQVDNAAVNHNKMFLRKGQIGDWKNHFSAELASRMDSWIKENLAGTDLTFVSNSAEESN